MKAVLVKAPAEGMKLLEVPKGITSIKVCPKCDGEGGKIVSGHDCWGNYEPDWRSCSCAGGYIIKRRK